MKKVLFLLFTFAILLSYFAWDFARFKSTTNQILTDKIFAVQPGETFRSVRQRLEQEYFISSGWRFELLARSQGVASQIRSGEYLLPRECSPLQILEILVNGKSIEYSLTVQEGLNRFEIAQSFANLGLGTPEDFLSVTEDRAFIKELLGEELPSLEGYLFPETYKLTKFTGARTLVKTMVQKFLKTYAAATQGKSLMPRHRLVILASLIEKETGVEADRTKVSSVFHNRLKKGMPLQTDPTVLYGMMLRDRKVVMNITKQDLLTKNPYNTYTFVGLPFGPISNPGLNSINAALNPAQTELLYFVSRNDGTSEFSESLNQHSAAVRKYQLNSKAREGKSWRNLKRQANGQK